MARASDCATRVRARVNPPGLNADNVRRLQRNRGGYRGETIDIRAVLRQVGIAAQQHGWSAETFHTAADFRWLALRRPPPSILNAQRSTRLYLSAGIHGDEPAGPLAMLRLLETDAWPHEFELWALPCLNPTGFLLNRRENAAGVDLNRDYRHPETAEVRAHVTWLARQPAFDVTLCLHEDWEARGFYVYELNPDNRPSPAPHIIEGLAKVCPIDRSEVIENRPASGGIIRPNLDPRTRPQWPEAFYLLQNKTRLSCTLEAPSDFPLAVRVNALVAGVRAALEAVRL